MQDKRVEWNRRQFMNAAAAVAAGGLTGASYAQDAGGPIVLGQSCALSGPSAQLGTQFAQGAKLYFDQLNAQGGIGRRQVSCARWTTVTSPNAACPIPRNSLPTM